jgi:hypothetical protein
MKKLYVAAVAIGAAAVIASVAALILDKSLPYRIGLANYPTYLWADRLTGVPVALALLSLVSGCAVKRRIPLVLGLLSLALLFLFMSYVRSGPNPQAWCFNNLRAIDGAKDELAVRRDFTNGTAVTFTEISPFLRKGTDLAAPKGASTLSIRLEKTLAALFTALSPRSKRVGRNRWSPTLHRARR